MYKIKFKCEDFIVKEVLKLKKKKGNYKYYLVKKKDWNTLDLVRLIANKLGMKAKDVRYAGLKDKRAITEQFISIKGKDIKFKIKDVSFKKIGEGDEPIRLGGLIGNNFEIVVRNLTSKKNLKISKIENYFDSQRFGGSNVEVGRALLKRNFKDLVKLLNVKNKEEVFRFDRKFLRFALNSYQSYVFNIALKKIIDKKVKAKKLPLINFDTEFKDRKIEKIYNEILNREGIDRKDFIFREMPFLVSEGKDRDCFVKVEKFSFKYSKDGENFKCVLKFYLKKGSYGTLVVKKLFSKGL